MDATQLVRERRLGHRERHLARRAANEDFKRTSLRSSWIPRTRGREFALAWPTPAAPAPARAPSPAGAAFGVRAAALLAACGVKAARAAVPLSAKISTCGARARATTTAPKPFIREVCAGLAADTTARVPFAAIAWRSEVERAMPNQSRSRGPSPARCSRARFPPSRRSSYQRTPAPPAPASVTHDRRGHGGDGLLRHPTVRATESEIKKAYRTSPGCTQTRTRTTRSTPSQVQVCERGVRVSVDEKKKELYFLCEDGLRDGFGGGGGGFHASNVRGRRRQLQRPRRRAEVIRSTRPRMLLLSRDFGVCSV